MGWHVLTTARAFWISGEEAEESLRAAGCSVTRSPSAGPVPEQELVPLLRDCDAVIGSSDPYTARVFAECPLLKVVSRCGVGFDSVDVPAATEAGVMVTTTPGAMSEAVADYAMALLLAVARRISEGDALMKSGGWGEYRGVLVCGKTLGIVGLGAIGREVASRAAGFGMRILVYDPIVAASCPTPNAPGPAPAVEFVDLDELVGQSDFVSIHAPATPETRHMFDADRIGRMKPTAYLINTARGSLVDQTALLEALESGRIAGAALDVYDKEPLPADSPLRRAPNCVLTPHNGFNALEAAQRMSVLSAENILSAMKGERPYGILNPEVLTSARLRTR